MNFSAGSDPIWLWALRGIAAAYFLWMLYALHARSRRDDRADMRRAARRWSGGK